MVMMLTVQAQEFVVVGFVLSPTNAVAQAAHHHHRLHLLLHHHLHLLASVNAIVVKAKRVNGMVRHMNVYVRILRVVM